MEIASTSTHFLSGLETLALVAASLAPTQVQISASATQETAGMEIGVGVSAAGASSPSSSSSLAKEEAGKDAETPRGEGDAAMQQDAEMAEASGEHTENDDAVKKDDGDKVETSVKDKVKVEAKVDSKRNDKQAPLPSRRVTRRSLAALLSSSSSSSPAKQKPAPYKLTDKVRKTRNPKNHPLPSPTADVIKQSAQSEYKKTTPIPSISAPEPKPKPATEPSTPQPSSTPSSDADEDDDEDDDNEDDDASFSSVSPTASMSALAAHRRSSLPPLKARANFPAESLKFLTRWLDANKKDPYPSADEKNIMVKESGLSLTQINNWFINARRRRI
ncbi:hypothetical protein HDU98_002895 [Podochytrium sp. JEL0797]|nr:hypothetical protein HDU98_002895 [Podochytrium sp. JEL0797]